MSNTLLPVRNQLVKLQTTCLVDSVIMAPALAIFTMLKDGNVVRSGKFLNPVCD